MQGTKNLTQGPIKRQLFNLALPIMGTSFIQMAYSITDMAWVGRLGSEAVAAIGAVGILTWMTNSISLLNKVGSEVSVGQSIGARNEEDARNYSSHNLTIALIISICWGLLLFVFANPIIGVYKLEAPIAANAVEYLRIVSTAFPFIFLSAAFTGIHNAAGLSKIPFYISGTGLIINMILDPVFIFVFDMGTPVKIADLARRMIELAGLVPDKDIEIQYTGLRPGEKLYEELLAIKENTLPTSNEKIYRAQVREYDFNEINNLMEPLVHLALCVDKIGTVKMMKEIVPEFKSKNSEYEVLDKQQ